MKKVLKITESQYKKLLLLEQNYQLPRGYDKTIPSDATNFDKSYFPPQNIPQYGVKEFKMDYKKLKNNPSPEYIAAVIKNSRGKWGDQEAWAQSAFEAIKDYDTYNKVKQILKADPYKFVKLFMSTDIDYHKNGNTIDKLYYKIHNIEGYETPFKMDGTTIYKKLKNNPSPKYIADVLENSKGGIWDDKEAWVQSAFNAIKNQETYYKVEEFLGGYDPYEYVKSFMSTDIDYHDDGNTIDKLYDKLFPEKPRFHFMCNKLSARTSKYGTIPKHGEKCYSCGKELREYCRSKGLVATLETMKGSDWDEFFGKRKNSKYELPMYGGHWDNDEYTYCLCAKGETKLSGKDYYFLEDKNTYISAPPSETELKLIRQQRREYIELIKKNATNPSLIESFDCSEYRKNDEWWKYQQCLTENMSMAVSVVPGIGTVVSAILDLVNTVSYLGSAVLGSSERIQSEDFLMAAISLGSILPVFGEVRAVSKIGSREAKATQKILKELEQNGLTELKSAGKIDESFSMINKAYTKHASNLNSYEKKNVNKIMENIKKIDVTVMNNQINVLEDILKGYEKQGLKQHHLHKLLKDKNFTDLLNKNGNDLSKTLKSQQGKEMITNIIVQLGVGGFIASLNTKLNKLEKETEERKNTSLKSLGYSDEEIAKIESEVQSKVTINLEEETKIIEIIDKKYENAIPKQKLEQETKNIIKNIKVNIVIKESVDTLNEKGDTTNITPQKVVDTAVVVSKTSKWIQNFDHLKMKNEQNTMKMKNKIIITESQFKRLFLEQLSVEECEKDEDLKELLDKVKKNYSEKNPQPYYLGDSKVCVIKLYDANFNIYLHVNDNKIVIRDINNNKNLYTSKYIIEDNEIKILEKPTPYKNKYPEWQYVTPKVLSDIFDIFNSNNQSTQSQKPSESDEILNKLNKKVKNNDCDTVYYLAVDFSPRLVGHDTFCNVMDKFMNDHNNKTPRQIIKDKGIGNRKGCFKNTRLYSNRYDLIVKNEKYFNEKCNK